MSFYLVLYSVSLSHYFTNQVNIMKLSDFQKKFKHRINPAMSYDCIGKIRQWVDFDFDVYLPTKGVNLQRELCWTLEQKQALIISMLRGMHFVPFPIVQLKEREGKLDQKYQWQVIDGKQRLTTCFAFLDNEFPINVDGIDYYFNDLPEDIRKYIFRFDFRWDIHYHYPDDPITDQTKIDLFESINFFGTPVELSHIQKLKQ